MTIDLDELERLLAAATAGDWSVCIYDAGDCEHYDHNGPCPSVQAESEDCAIVHWDGFKQKYWSSANGNQRQIEANAALIVTLHNSAPAMIAELRELRAENARLKEALSHAQGRFLNIKIALSSNGTKREAILIADVGKDCAKNALARAALGEPQ